MRWVSNSRMVESLPSHHQCAASLPIQWSPIASKNLGFASQVPSARMSAIACNVRCHQTSSRTCLSSVLRSQHLSMHSENSRPTTSPHSNASTAPRLRAHALLKASTSHWDHLKGMWRTLRAAKNDQFFASLLFILVKYSPRTFGTNTLLYSRRRQFLIPCPNEWAYPSTEQKSSRSIAPLTTRRTPSCTALVSSQK